MEGDLAGAIDAVQRERWPEALAPTLAVWRSVRAPELADAYDAIAARALEVITPPFATDPAERNSRWLELRSTSRIRCCKSITIAEPRRPESSVVLHRVRQVLATQTGAKLTLTF